MDDSNGGSSQCSIVVLEKENVVPINPKQYKRILIRRQARAKLEAQGRIPKTRKKFLHHSRHNHAMNRIRDRGGRFGSGSVKKMKRDELHAPCDDKSVGNQPLIDDLDPAKIIDKFDNESVQKNAVNGVHDEGERFCSVSVSDRKIEELPVHSCDNFENNQYDTTDDFNYPMIIQDMFLSDLDPLALTDEE